MFQRGLTRHVRRNHTEHPVFDCSQCGRSFARHGNLEKHRRNCTCCSPAAKRQRVDVPVPVPVLFRLVFQSLCCVSLADHLEVV